MDHAGVAPKNRTGRGSYEWSTAVLASSQTLRVSALRAAGGLDPIPSVDSLALKRSTRSADREFGRAIFYRAAELARRSVTERLMRMNCIIVFEPAIELLHHRRGIRPRTDPRIVPLEGLHEGLGHAVRLRALNRRGARHQADQPCQCAGIGGDVGRAVVGQPLDRLWQLVYRSEACSTLSTIRSRMSLPRYRRWWRSRRSPRGRSSRG